MSVPRDLRCAIVDRFKEAGLGFKDVQAHIGRYSIDDLKAMHRSSPAMKVGLVGASKPKPCASGEVQVDLSFAAVVVTRSARIEDADDDAIDLAVAVAANLSTFVPATKVRACQPAIDIHLEPVADDEVDKAGLAVWVVLWSHTARIGTDAIGAGISEPHTPPADPVITVVGNGEETALGGVS